MLQHIRSYSFFAIYLLIFSYTWAFCKAPICDFLYTIAHTASVMNADLYQKHSKSHQHSQEIAISDLQMLKLATEESPQEKDQHQLALELEKQVKILNALVPISQETYQIYHSNFPSPSKLKNLYQSILLPPPRF